MKEKLATLIIPVLMFVFMISIFQAGIASANPAVMSVPDEYSTIQEAINAANPNDIVLVGLGVYNENINIDKSLTVKSVEGAGATVINAQEAPMAVLINGTGTIATFDGFTVENYLTVGILAGAFSPTWGEDPNEVHILNNIVKEPVGDAHNNCIQVGDGTTGTIIGNDVSGAFLEDPDWSGSGILVAGSSNVLVSNNYVHNCEGGIQIAGYEDYRDAPAVNNIVESNLVEGNETGICVQMKSTGTIVRYNDVLNNDEGIAVMAIDYSWEQSTPSGTEIHYNNIIGNASVVSSIWGSETGEVPTENVDATFNWWGTTNNADIFAGISGAVNFSLWLDAPYPEGMTTEEKLAQKEIEMAQQQQIIDSLTNSLAIAEAEYLAQTKNVYRSLTNAQIRNAELEEELNYWMSLSIARPAPAGGIGEDEGQIMFTCAFAVIGVEVMLIVKKFTGGRSNKKLRESQVKKLKQLKKL